MRHGLCIFLGSCLALLGCTEEKTEKIDAGGIDAGSPGLVVGGKLGQALASAQQQGAKAPPSGAKDGDGPPENGVFTPAGADKAVPKDGMKIDLVSDGSEPRAQLAYKIPDEQKTALSVLIRTGQQGIPPLTFGLTLKKDKPKDAKDDAKTDGASIVGTVTSVSLPREGGALPKDAADLLGKLKGTEIRYSMGNDGVIKGSSYKLSKDADPGLENAVASVAESLVLLTPAFPQKPVGLGAYWMVGDRASSFGVDVVRYRLFKIEKIEKDQVSLSIDVRQYAGKPDVELGKGQKFTLDRFESQGKGSVGWTPLGITSQSGEGDLQSKAQLTTAQGQKGMLQGQLTVKFEAPDAKADKDPKKK